jgi:hypothetical protein
MTLVGKCLPWAICSGAPRKREGPCKIRGREPEENPKFIIDATAGVKSNLLSPVWLSSMTEITHDKRASGSSPEAGHQVDTNKPIETTEQLRIAIDQGHGKVDATDPAAAPLGTDDEAAGTPNTMAQVRLAAAHEIRPNKKRQRTAGLGAAWWVIGGSLLVGVSIVTSAIWILP